MKFVKCLSFATILFFVACKKDVDTPVEPPVIVPQENISSFAEVGAVTIGGTGAAEITAYDPSTKKLFVVSNVGGATRVDIVNLANPASPVLAGFIDISPYGSNINSVAVYDGKLAAAIEGSVKTDLGKVVVFKTTDYTVIKQITVGALPDMVTFSADGKYILTANEGEPNDAYTIDPVGSVSIITVADNYAVVTLDFTSFASQLTTLQTGGLRMFGPAASFAQDMEPEYVTISADGNTAWVTLQENNAIAKVNLTTKLITNIFPLGFKDYNTDANAIDPSDRDLTIVLNRWNVKGIYQPDAIAVYEKNGIPYLFTANEGDTRDYPGFSELKRIKDVALDATVFPDAATLKLDTKLGRLNITKTLGDIGTDNDFDELYAFGARSFSVWNGNTGAQIFDSKNQLEQKVIEATKYDDLRSDDKGVEPEGITIGKMGGKVVAFVGMERADVMAVYDITDPANPVFLKILNTGDAPEGITFIPAAQSPNGKSIVIVSSENDGVIKIYTTS
jgi:DNA-binding beta-propeller fold protein YncE